MKKSILLVGSIVFASIVFGQTNTNVKSGDGLSSTSETPTRLAVGNEKVSDYFQFEKKIISWVKGVVIPASVPKHKISQSKSDYALVLLDWAKDNENLLQDKFKAKISDDVQYAEMITKAKEIK
jgi:hypothetical protein